MSEGWTLYVIRCRDGSLYTGVTTDLDRRLQQHNAGKGGAYTRAKRPVRLIYSESHPDRSAALKGEARMKALSKTEKERLLSDVS
jgi:putative endonuclease